MIHSIVKLARPFIVFDLETTSVIPEDARIVELAFQLFSVDGTMTEWRSLINPGIPIPPDTTRVHGITNEDVTVHCWQCRLRTEAHPTPECEQFRPVPRFEDLAPRLAKGFTGCDFGGKNIRYDLRVLAASFQRIGIRWSYAGAAVIDADRIEQIGEPRNLAAMYERRTGKKLEGAHQAMNDVRATTELIVAQLQQFRGLPRDLQQLHRVLWPNYIDAEGKFRFRDGVPICSFGKHTGRKMEDINNEYYKWILKSGFSEEVKELAREAIAGRFPKEANGDSSDA